MNSCFLLSYLLLSEEQQVLLFAPLSSKSFNSFPKDFKWVGTKTEVEQMIGNAVPVNLGKFVAETVKIVAEAEENK